VETHWSVHLLLLLTVPALIAVNGLFVAAEFALVAMRKTRAEELAAQGVKGAAAVLHALNNLDRTIAATQLGITLASLGLGLVAEPALASLVEPLFVWAAPSWRGPLTHTLATMLAFLLITCLGVLFGELIPKAVALQSPDRTALWLTRPLLAFATLTRPLIRLINGTGGLILRRWGYTMPTGEGMVHSVEELQLLIEDTEEAGILEPEQADLLENVFLLSEKKVGDCMVPRDKMDALELSMPPEKVLEAVREGAHTRMPVYKGELDNIVGVVNTKDLFYLFSLRHVVVLDDATYPALFLPPEAPLSDALRLFRKAKRPMALVRDDGGRILGLITLEDVLEEIVGELEDEHDRPPPKVSPRLLQRLRQKKKA
jgi:CBS domain containing-hemolysin-like protein